MQSTAEPIGPYFVDSGATSTGKKPKVSHHFLSCFPNYTADALGQSSCEVLLHVGQVHSDLLIATNKY